MFLASQVRGRWQPARAVPGIRHLEGSDSAGISLLSCGSPGNCIAGGDYEAALAGHNVGEAFVVSQAHGTWGTARRIPGLAALNSGGDAAVTSRSCPSAGNCSAGGYYADSPDTVQAFAVTQRHGRWSTALEVHGTAALNTYGYAEVQSVSCTSAGNCTAAGTPPA